MGDNIEQFVIADGVTATAYPNSGDFVLTSKGHNDVEVRKTRDPLLHYLISELIERTS